MAKKRSFGDTKMMRQISLYVTEERHARARALQLDELVKRDLFPNRAEAIREAIRDLIDRGGA